MLADGSEWLESVLQSTSQRLFELDVPVALGAVLLLLLDLRLEDPGGTVFSDVFAGPEGVLLDTVRVMFPR